MEKISSKIHPLVNRIFQKSFKKSLHIETLTQLLRHYSMGLIGAVINYAFFNILKYAGLGTKIANSITYIVLLIIMFLLQKHYTYRVQHHSLWQPVLFVVNAGVYFVLDTTILVLLIDRLHIVPAISKLVSLVMLAPLSFIFQKFIVFKKREETKT